MKNEETPYIVENGKVVPNWSSAYRNMYADILVTYSNPKPIEKPTKENEIRKMA